MSVVKFVVVRGRSTKARGQKIPTKTALNVHGEKLLAAVTRAELPATVRLGESPCLADACQGGSPAPLAPEAANKSEANGHFLHQSNELRSGRIP